MAKFTHQNYSNKTVKLDGHEYYGCNFDGCVLVYRGGKPPVLTDSSITNCQFRLDGPAGDTGGFLRMLYHHGREGRAMVIDVISRNDDPVH